MRYTRKRKAKSEMSEKMAVDIRNGRVYSCNLSKNEYHHFLIEKHSVKTYAFDVAA